MSASGIQFPGGIDGHPRSEVRLNLYIYSQDLVPNRKDTQDLNSLRVYF